MNVAVPAALAGAADTAAFLATRFETLRRQRGRMVGSMAMLWLWLAAAGMAVRNRSDGRATGVAAGLALANAALLAAHLRARVASPRVIAGAALSGVVLADLMRRRSGSSGQEEVAG